MSGQPVHARTPLNFLQIDRGASLPQF